MSFEIGNKAHKLFPLAETPGRITNITSWPRTGGRINAEQLTEFQFLAEGERHKIDEACAIEVVDFAHNSSRGHDMPFLQVSRVGVARGAELVGPLAWRTNGAMETPPKPAFHIPRLLLPAVALAFLWPVANALHQAHLAGVLVSHAEHIFADNVWWLIGTMVFTMLSLANAALKENLNALEKNPVVKVHTPARRLWA